MATQAVLIADTVAGMRRAVANHHDTSDSDDSFYGHTNRGNKLKRKAEYVREGQLDMPNGPKVYKRKIEHAGHKRYIIHRNPKRYDEDGDLLDDDEVDEQADLDAAARNPYHDIRLEELLAPLTSAADLPNHPSMSIPYKSSTITDMVKQSSEMLHREQRSLWNVKQMVTKLRGDETWIPCGALNSDVDDVIFDIGPIYKNIIESELLHNATLVKGPTLVNGEAVAQKPAVTKKVTPSTFTAIISESPKNSGEKIHETPSENITDPPGVSKSEPTVPGPDDAANGSYNDPGSLGDKNTNVDIKGESPSPVDKVLNGFSVGGNITVEDSRSLDSENHSSHVQFQANKVGLNLGQGDPPNPTENVSQREQDEAPVVDAATTIVTNGETNNRTNQGLNPSSMGALKEGSIGADDSGDAFQASRHRMQTRAQAQAKSENTPSSQTRSASPASWTPPVIHPLYLMPASAYPDRNFGLPPVEAEETRRMVTLYTQKQEEVCRSAEKLYFGLLRADRMRKTVFRWCKAEGHVGEMSDGEDWYDKEEWGLDEDLRKGQEEEEDDKDKEKDGTGPQAKKTRKTRVPTLK